MEKSFTEFLLPGTLFADLSDSQKSAIIFSIELGEKIKILFPDVAEDYKNGISFSELVSKYDLESVLKVGKKLAESAVSYAIKGYDGHMRISGSKPYSGLLTDPDQIREIGKQHNRENSEKQGIFVRDNKLGIFSINKERRSEIGRNSVLKQKKQKIGFYGKTHEERQEIGKLGAIACGMEPYSPQEILLVEKLMEDPQYRKRGLVKVKEISNVLNKVIHGGKPVRKPRSISKLIFRKIRKNTIKKSQEGK